VKRKHIRLPIILSVLVAVASSVYNTPGTQAGTSNTAEIEIHISVANWTFAETAQHATDVVVAEFVTTRPFGQNLTEFEFIVHERVFGNAADRIFVYEGKSVSALRGNEQPFTAGRQYLLLLYNLADVYATTHEDGFLFLTDLVLDVNAPARGTMYGEPLRRHSMGMNFNRIGLTRRGIVSYVSRLTRDNTPVREFIRSENLEDIIADLPYVLVVEICAPFRLVSEQTTSDWVESDIFYATVVEVLKGDVDVGIELNISFFANTMQTGERHIVAVKRLTPGSTTFSFTSRNSLFAMDQLDEILTILNYHNNHIESGD